MTTAPTGVGIFIWEPSYCEGGDWGKIIEKATQIGLKWIILHGFWSQPVISRLHTAGFYVAYSAYVTPNGADNAVADFSRAKTAGVDAVLIDAEVEWETLDGHPCWRGVEATAFITKLRQAMGDTWIGNAGAWQWPKMHPQYPDKEFAMGVDAAMPERYWTEFSPDTPYAKSVTESELEWKTYADVRGYKAVIPIGSAYGLNGEVKAGHQDLKPEDLRDFLMRNDTCALWSWLHIPDFAWNVISAAIFDKAVTT